MRFEDAANALLREGADARYAGSGVYASAFMSSWAAGPSILRDWKKEEAIRQSDRDATWIDSDDDSELEEATHNDNAGIAQEHMPESECPRTRAHASHVLAFHKAKRDTQERVLPYPLMQQLVRDAGKDVVEDVVQYDERVFALLAMVVEDGVVRRFQDGGAENYSNATACQRFLSDCHLEAYSSDHDVQLETCKAIQRIEDPVALRRAFSALQSFRDAKARDLACFAERTQARVGPAQQLVNHLEAVGRTADRYATLVSFMARRIAVSTTRSTLEDAQQKVREAARTHDSEPNHCQLLKPLIDARNECERTLRTALDAVTAGFKQHELHREEGVLNEELALLQDLTPLNPASKDPSSIDVEGTSESKGDYDTDALNDALCQFAKWLRDKDPERQTNSTDDAVAAAWRALRAMADTAGEEGDGWQRACSAARDAIVAERKWWVEIVRPENVLPIHALNKAATTRIKICNELTDALKQARQNARDARFESDELQKISSVNVDDAIVVEAERRVADAKKRLRHAIRDLEDAEEDDGDVAATQTEVSAAQSALQATQRRLEDERAKLVRLSESHRPELVAFVPSLRTLSAILLDVPVMKDGRTLAQYGTPVPWPRLDLAPVACRHPIRLYKFDNEFVVLKEFSLNDPSQSRMIKREAKALHRLAHPNVIELQAVFLDETQHGGILRAYAQLPLYAGGTLRAWLARKEHIPSAILSGDHIAVFDPTDPTCALVHLRALRQMLAAIVHVHANGVVHGDIKLVRRCLCVWYTTMFARVSAPDFAVSLQENVFVEASLDLDDDGGSANDADGARAAEGLARLNTQVQAAMGARDAAAVRRLVAERDALKRTSAAPSAAATWATREWRVVLGDFDLSRTDTDSSIVASVMTTRVGGGGTPGYTAPEVLAGERPVKPSDIFSLGITLLLALAADAVTKELVVRGGDDFRTSTGPAVLRLCNASSLVPMLSTEPVDRPLASELLSSAFFSSDSALTLGTTSREAAMRVCTLAVCRRKVPKNEGVACSDEDDSHFVCDECLTGHVRANSDMDALRLLEAHGGLVRCICHPPPLGGCTRTYSDRAIARHIPQRDFGVYFVAKQRLAEQRIAAELEAGVQRRIDDEVARISALSEVDRRTAEMRKHIIERILTLACPRCGAAFAEDLDGENGFNGCCALTCHRAACGCGFCAYCLVDCGHDAHAHVQQCQYGDGLFVEHDRFKAVQKARRERMLNEYLATLTAHDRETAVFDVAHELGELDLVPENFLADNYGDDDG